MPAPPDKPRTNGHVPRVPFSGGPDSAADEAEETDALAEPSVTPPLPLPPPPPAVAELCAACMRFVASKYKVPLDGTPETLSLLDQYVRDAREAIQERPNTVDLVGPAVGAYLGEVMRQTFGAEWWAEGEHEGWRLYFTRVYLAFNPIGMGREAVLMADEPGWHAHLDVDPGDRDAVEERVAAMPDVDEEEYYLPTTRLEVVAAIVDMLRARAESSGTGDVTFTKDDYS
jgi:hypothetical protein